MMRRRGRRRFAGPKWTFSNSTNFNVDSTGPQSSPGGLYYDYAWILPPARAQFMMNTKGRDRMQFAGCHLWLDFFWRNTGTATGLPDVSFMMYKSEIVADTGLPDPTPIDGQWKEPATPASLTSWDEDDDDGTEPYLWQHWIKGSSPPNAIVNTGGVMFSGSDIQNQGVQMQAGTTDTPTYACRKFMVQQEWQPDVIVRTRRRITKGEGIVLVMAVIAPSSNLHSNLNVHWRTLTK